MIATIPCTQGTDHCRCSTTTGGCGESFNSTAAFDMRRVGKCGGPDRRCRTPAEMVKAGMAINGKGRWAKRPASWRGGNPKTQAIRPDPIPTPRPPPLRAAKPSFAGSP